VLFLIDRHRSREVLIRVLGESFARTLVSDFYATYQGLDCAKQRCLVHLLRELARLREELPWQSVRAFIQPLIELFQDAIQLGKDREKLDHAAFGEAYQRLIERFDDLMLRTRLQHSDCVRIWKRKYKHCDELFTFLDDQAVPADNNGAERDIRSLAAARSDGGTHRADWSATAFARLKSVIVTGMKNQVRFIQYGIEVIRAKFRVERLPLPLAATPDTSYPRTGINRPPSGHPVHPHVLGFEGTPVAINRFRPRAPCSSPQTCPTTPVPPARRGYDDCARRARLISYPEVGWRSCNARAL
jgi:hypothetical protein